MKKIIFYCLFLFNISSLSGQNNISFAFSYSNGLNSEYFNSYQRFTQHQGDMLVNFSRNPMFYSFQWDYNIKDNKVSWGSGITWMRKTLVIRYDVGTTANLLKGGSDIIINIISIPLRYTRRISLNKNTNLVGSVNLGLERPERINRRTNRRENNTRSLEYTYAFWSATTTVSVGFDIALENDFGKWGQIVLGVGKYRRLGDSYIFNMNYAITRNDNNTATIGNFQRGITEDVWRTYLTYRLPIRFKISRL